MSRKAIVWIDGAARGNPGPSGIGVHIEDGAGGALKELSEYLGGDYTNNQAEYIALIRALEECRALKVDEIEVRSDSQLLVRQMNGRYRVRSDNIRDLHEKARKIESDLGNVSYVHIDRENNSIADELANNAIDDKDE